MKREDFVKVAEEALDSLPDAIVFFSLSRLLGGDCRTMLRLT